MRPARRRHTSLGPHDMLLLDAFGRSLREAFEEIPYLVGSVMAGGPYRDVDVRLETNAKWLRNEHRRRTINLALTMWGRQVTGLPLDVQFQDRTEFHSYDGRPRRALGVW